MFQARKLKPLSKQAFRPDFLLISKLMSTILGVTLASFFPLSIQAQEMADRSKLLAPIEELVVQNKFQDAIVEYSKVINRFPEAQIYILRGSTQILAKNYAAALSDFQLAEDAARKEKNSDLAEVAQIYALEMQSLLNQPQR